MTESYPTAEDFDRQLIEEFEAVKETVAGVRTIRLQKNIANKEQLKLQVTKGQHNSQYDSVIAKMCNLSAIERADAADATALTFMVGTTEYAVPLENQIDVEAEIKKAEEEIAYYEGFLATVMKKLGNEKFVANAKPEIVEKERKKKSDAESKIEALKNKIAGLKK